LFLSVIFSFNLTPLIPLSKLQGKTILIRRMFGEGRSKVISQSKQKPIFNEIATPFLQQFNAANLECKKWTTGK